MSILRIKLDDGSTVEGSLDGPISPDVDEIIAAGPVHIALEADEVEGHELSSLVRLTISGADDTEGHALSLRLPDAKAARDLERRLLATGVLVGVVVVGAVSANAIATSPTTSSNLSAVAAAELAHDSRLPVAAVAAADPVTDSRLPVAAVAAADAVTDSRLPVAAVAAADAVTDSRLPVSAGDEPSGSGPANLRVR